MGKKQKTPSGSVNVGNDDDVLGLLREINMDNQETFEGSEKNKSKKHGSNEKESTEKPVDFSTPKRKRSISNNRPQSTKGSKNSDELLLHTPNTDGTKKSLESKLKREKRRNESTDTDQLVSPSSNKTPVSKENKGIKKTHNDIVSSSPKKSANTDSSKRTSELGILNGSLKRHKPTLNSGLAKCSTHDSSITNLVGERIKVWWPLDKKFYKGVVESYNSSKKKHTVLYDDGDVEVLNLAKEKWTLIESNDLSVKKQKKNHPEQNQGWAQERTSTRKQTPPTQHKSKKRSSPPKRKGQPKKQT
jgi:sister-chromatid-cohesion protein PDS5